MSVTIEEIFLKYFLNVPLQFDVLVSVTIEGNSFDVSLNVEIGGVNNGNEF